MIISFVFGILLSFKINVESNFQETPKSFFEKAFSCFVFNFWFIFLIWHFGKTKGLFLICYLLVFIKFLLLGLTFFINLKSGNTLSFLKYFIWDLVLLFPLLGIVLYDVSLNNFVEEKKKSPYFQIMFYFLWVLIYSLVSGFVGS